MYRAVPSIEAHNDPVSQPESLSSPTPVKQALMLFGTRVTPFHIRHSKTGAEDSYNDFQAL